MSKLVLDVGSGSEYKHNPLQGENVIHLDIKRGVHKIDVQGDAFLLFDYSLIYVSSEA